MLIMKVGEHMPKSNPELAAAMGKRMTARRKELGLTQEAVADMAGIAHQQYNKAENGKCCLSADSLFRITSVLKISADYLLTGRSTDPRYQETIDILNKLTEHQLVLANQMLQCLVHFNDK